MPEIIFCPNCHRFVGLNDKCKHCGWTRPPQPSAIGQIKWETRLAREEPAPGMPPFPARIACANGLIFLPTETGDIVALDVETGQVKWQRTLRADRKLRTTAIAAWEEMILIGAEHLADLPTRDRKLMAWQAATGQDVWDWPTAADSLSIPLVHEDTACFASSEPRLYALDLKARQLCWSTPSLTWSPEPPAIHGDIVVVPSRGPFAAAYSRKQGARLWTFEADDKDTEWLHQRPAVTADIAYLAGWEKRVYAVNLTTGKLRWRFQTERGVTCPPGLAGDKLLVCVKDYRSNNGERKTGYGLYALDAATGELAWKVRTDKHIYISPAVCGDVILLAADDRRLRALDLHDGRELWQVALPDRLRAGPLVVGDHVIVGQRNGVLVNIQWKVEPPVRPDPDELLLQGKPVEAAAEMALRGQYEQAARLFADNGELEHAAALHLEADQLDQAAIFYRQLGALDRALDLHRQVGDRRGEADVLTLQGRHDEAAPLYEAIGELDLAAHEYTAAGRAGYAAQLLRKIGRRQEAAQLYQSVNQADQAAETLVEDGKHIEAAEMFQRMGKPEVAAGVLAQGGKLAEAAALYEQIGRTALAADMYAQAGQTAQALALYEQLQDWKRVAELAEAGGELLLQAHALAELGQTARAAQLYESAGDPDRALELYAVLEQWEKVEALARQLARWEQQAHALETLGRVSEAGEAYGRAAESLHARIPEAAEELARLYEAAARCYAEDENWTRQQACWDQVCQCRGWPNLRGRFEFSGPFCQSEFNQVNLVIRNVGYSLARNIMIAGISRKFRLDTSESETTVARLPSVPQQQEKTMRLSLQPQPDILGRVMLRVRVSYQDRTGLAHQEEFAQSVEVLGRDEKIAVLGRPTPTPATPPQVINVPGGKVVMGGTLVEGDQLVGTGAQKGDRVEIKLDDSSTLQQRPSHPAAEEQIGAPKEAEPTDRARLRNALVKHFDDSELRDVCFDLGIPYDSLQGEGRSDKARELVAYCERHGMYDKLIEMCRQLRPNVEW
jgi:outer membrane protein assembly factor BamB